MADRRMFSKSIIDSDEFLDMPLSTQALYFHLAMRADDDGFINNPRKIQRIVGCGNDDIKLLIAKQFIIPFESGIVVIKHWRVHNYIQKDRYKPTMYQDEKSQLDIKPNKPYTIKNDGENDMDTPCIQDVSNMETQVRLGKVRLGKVSIEGEIDRGVGEDDPEPAPPLPPDHPEECVVDIAPQPKRTDYQKVLDLYNSICVSLPKADRLSDVRKKAIKARLNKFTMEDLERAFRIAEESQFLKGSNNRNWIANLDWMLKEANLVKILDGNYSERQKRNGVDYSSGKEPTPWMIDGVRRTMQEAINNGYSFGDSPHDYARDGPGNSGSG